MIFSRIVSAILVLQLLTFFFPQILLWVPVEWAMWNLFAFAIACLLAIVVQVARLLDDDDDEEDAIVVIFGCAFPGLSIYILSSVGELVVLAEKNAGQSPSGVDSLFVTVFSIFFLGITVWNLSRSRNPYW